MTFVDTGRARRVRKDPAYGVPYGVPITAEDM